MQAEWSCEKFSQAMHSEAKHAKSCIVQQGTAKQVERGTEQVGSVQQA